MVFPVMMIGVEIGAEVTMNRHDPSLDGFNYVERAHETEALRWLNNRSRSSSKRRRIVRVDESGYDLLRTARANWMGS